MHDRQPRIRVRPAAPADLTLILSFIRGLAEYERLLDKCVATEESLREHLFGPRPYCEVVIGEDDAGPAGFALSFTSTRTSSCRT